MFDIYLPSFSDELARVARDGLEKISMPIHVLTGRSGGGKSTEAKKLKGYDLKVGTDTGRPDGKGGYIVQTPEVRDQLRNEKLGKILKADARGKNVLVEGGPGAVDKIFGPHTGRIGKVMELDTPVREAMRGVRRRSVERNSSVIEDVKTAVHYNRRYRKDMASLAQKVGKIVKIKRGSVEKLSYVAKTPTMRAKVQAEKHFESSDPNWNSFEKNLKKKSFQKAVETDSRSDAKLKRYVENYGGMLTSKQVAAKVVSRDSGQPYTIKELPGGRMACSCKNWQYRRSVDGGDCKHITELVEGKMKTKTSADDRSEASRKRWAHQHSMMAAAPAAGVGAAGGYMLARGLRYPALWALGSGAAMGLSAYGAGRMAWAAHYRKKDAEKGKTKTSLAHMVKEALLKGLAHEAVNSSITAGWNMKRTKKQLILGDAGSEIARRAQMEEQYPGRR